VSDVFSTNHTAVALGINGAAMMKSDCNRVRTGQSGTPTRSKKSNTYIIASSAPWKTKAVGRYKENGKAWTSRTSNRDASRRSRKI